MPEPISVMAARKYTIKCLNFVFNKKNCALRMQVDNQTPFHISVRNTKATKGLICC